MTDTHTLVHGGANGNGVETGPLSREQLDRGLGPLLAASRCAVDAHADLWSFAVEIDRLREAGLTDTHLRWLVFKGLVTHREEITLYGQQDRTFRDIGRLRFSSGSCFVLTPSGEELLATAGDSAQNGNGQLLARMFPPSEPSSGLPTLFPRWDDQRKELWLDGLLVKRFRVQSPNQETILTAFQEDGWPPRIDDPLQPIANQCAKRRLHDAIKNLNRHQAHRVMRFTGDGSGEGVLWEATR